VYLLLRDRQCNHIPTFLPHIFTTFLLPIFSPFLLVLSGSQCLTVLNHAACDGQAKAENSL
jgi:hypothetical protein